MSTIDIQPGDRFKRLRELYQIRGEKAWRIIDWEQARAWTSGYINGGDVTLEAAVIAIKAMGYIVVEAPAPVKVEEIATHQVVDRHTGIALAYGNLTQCKDWAGGTGAETRDIKRNLRAPLSANMLELISHIRNGAKFNDNKSLAMSAQAVLDEEGYTG